MKIKMIMVVAVVAAPLYINASRAAEPICDGGTCKKDAWWSDAANTFMGCNDATCTCVNAQTGTTTYTCAECTSNSDCGSNRQCVNYRCQQCPSCSDCNSTDWGAHSAGYQRRTVATCNCGVCNKTTQYRCATGYYGSSSNGTSGCTRCPSSGGVYGTSAAGSTAITSCYLPSGTSGTDSTGTWTYTQNCYYSN